MQIVGFDRTPEAALIISEAGSVERIPLQPGQTLEYALDERHCAGELTGAGHRPCDRPETPHCPEHTETWICARCRGSCLKDEMDCHQEHVVYLAAVAPAHFKVGVTRAERVRTRLHEQGADRGAVIHRVANGRIAREIETELAEDLPDRIPSGAKIRGLTRAVDEAAWERLLAEHQVQERIHPEYALDVPTAPVPETLACGRVIGTKGRLLVLDWRGSPYVTDLRELVGHRIGAGSPSPDLQSGLEAFS